MDGAERRRYGDEAFDPSERRGRPATYPSAYHDDGDEAGGLDISRIINIVWRGKWTILLCAVVLASLGFVWVKQQTPIYAASALLLIDGGDEKVIDLQAVVTGVDTSSAGLASQAEIIRSDQLADRVIEKLRLDLDPEFNGALTPSSPGFLRSAVRSVVPALEPALFGGVLDDAEAAPGVDPATREWSDERRAAIRGAFKARLGVAPQPRTYALRISFESADRKKAALIANTVSDQYIVDQLEAKFEGTQRATVWLNDRLGSLKERVQVAERAVEEYRSEIAAASGQSMEVTDQQLAQLNASLIEARAASAEARARFESIRRLRAAGRDVSSASGVLGSGSVAGARDKLSDLRRREAELSTRYGPKHPKMINLRAEIQDVQRTIGGEVSKVVESIRNELEVAEARERSLQESVDALQSRSFQQGQGSVRLRELEREAEASRLIYQSFLNRFKETSEQQGLQQTEARVIARADVPGAPARPNVDRTVMISGILGAGMGLALVFFFESINQTFRSKEEFEALTGLPVLASIPKMGLKKRRNDLFAYIRSKPNSAYAESVRNLRTSLLLADVDHPPKVFLVTSSVPSEGKSTLALSLAAISAAMGKRALLVECDLRRPTVKEIFPVANGEDLVSVVSGSASLNDAIIQDDRQDNLFALPGLVSSANPADILASQRFRTLVESLRESFDIVVLDSPPVLAVTDARILAKVADITVVASRWDETPRDLVQDAIRQLDIPGVKVAGAAMTMVDGEKMARYQAGYGKYGKDYKSYYGGYSNYYTN